MFEPVKFKDGNTRWLRTGDTIPLGRHEITHSLFDRYLMKKEMARHADISTVRRFSGIGPLPRLEEAG